MSLYSQTLIEARRDLRMAEGRRSLAGRTETPRHRVERIRLAQLVDALERFEAAKINRIREEVKRYG